MESARPDTTAATLERGSDSGNIRRCTGEASVMPICSTRVGVPLPTDVGKCQKTRTISLCGCNMKESRCTSIALLMKLRTQALAGVAALGTIGSEARTALPPGCYLAECFCFSRFRPSGAGGLLGSSLDGSFEGSSRSLATLARFPIAAPLIVTVERAARSMIA